MTYRLLDETDECTLAEECGHAEPESFTCDGQPMCNEHFAEHLLDCGICASDVAAHEDID